jgi:hypothetical protein
VVFVTTSGEPYEVFDTTSGEEEGAYEVFDATSDTTSGEGEEGRDMKGSQRRISTRYLSTRYPTRYQRTRLDEVSLTRCLTPRGARRGELAVRRAFRTRVALAVLRQAVIFNTYDRTVRWHGGGTVGRRSIALRRTP